MRIGGGGVVVVGASSLRAQGGVGFDIMCPYDGTIVSGDACAAAVSGDKAYAFVWAVV